MIVIVHQIIIDLMIVFTLMDLQQLMIMLMEMLYQIHHLPFVMS